MDVIRCEKGHYYNKALGDCPICAAEVAANIRKPDVYGPTIPEEDATSDIVLADPPIPNTLAGIPVWEVEDEPVTGIAVMQQDADLPERMVAGWLVCVAGPGKGKSYCLYTGTNMVGRSEKMDVRIAEDAAVSRENHASIAYDTREKRFFALRGETRNITYINGKALRLEAELKARDILEFGNSKMMFIPFCGEDFDWCDADRFCQP